MLAGRPSWKWQSAARYRACRLSGAISSRPIASLQLGRPAEAIELLDRLEKTSHAYPVSPVPYFLGIAYLATKQVEKGQLFIDRILRHGNSAQAFVLMGLAKRGHWGPVKGAVDDFKRAVELNPELAGVDRL